MADSYGVVAQVADSLLSIEAEMRRLDLWQSKRPHESAFQSTEPFCLDTLSFSQWIQFVFIERMKQIIENGHALPVSSGIAPMAEECFRDRPESRQRLIRELKVVDQLLSGN
ncbi:MAG: YqcC family protein [Marinobacter sp.]|uniref:YqcC family protein n=1 Tax=Marinobacter sp. TaxID=50741 RepID=UPI003F973CA3